MVNKRPEGYHSVTPSLPVQGADKLLDYLKKAFNAEEVYRMDGPDGRVAHAEVRIGDSMVMLGEPRDGKAMPGSFHLYVDDIDRAYKQAVDAGGKSIQAPADQFYGDRTGGIEDPSGNQWWVATHVEDVSPEELDKRAKALFA